NVSTIGSAPSFEDAPTMVDTPIITADMAATEIISADAIEDADPAEDTRSNVVGIGRAKGRHRFPTSQAPSPQRRGLLSISAAAALMVLAVTGGGAMFSQGALPGDSLYGVKQTTESALVGLTPGQGNKAQRQLDYAATRLDEVSQLNSEQAPAGDRGADISQALQGFNEQTAAGSKMWLASGSSNGAELGTLANWAQTQSQKLSALRSSMPPSAQPDADHSLRMLEDLRTRAQSLSNRQGCDKVTSGDADQLGPMPAKGACSTKESTSAPSIRTVAPPGLGSSSDGSSDQSGSSDSSDSSGSSGSSSGSSKSTKSKEEAPGLPGLSDLTGGGNSHSGVGKLPSKEQTKGGDLVPSTTEQTPKPGLNLPLLLPILFPANQQPKGSG
ncbi:MAG TPA: DUF5667 domain-containing protein, partial [Pseudonocardia sp.]|nr:DUF5667 domain-containing protein [Pseudonocardia sp.]